MNEIVELVVRLRDLASGNVQKMAELSQNSFGLIDNSIASTQSGLNELGRGLSIRVDHSGITRAGEEIAAVNEKMGLLTTGTAMFIGNIASQGVMEALRFAKDQVTDILGGGMEEGMTKMKINVLAGDKQGGQLYEGTTDYLKHSMYGSELFDADKQMLNLTVAANTIMPIMKQIGDIASGDGQELVDLSRAFGLVASTGHATGREILMMTRDGFNPLSEISRTTGKSMAELTEDVEKSRISLGMIEGAFKSATSEGGRYYHMMDRVMATPGGQWREFLTNLEYTKKGFGEDLMPAIGEVTASLLDMGNSLPSILKEMKPGIEGLIHDFADLVKWTTNNTETIGKFFGLVKVGAEAWVAWKIASVGMTGANWLWVQSLGAGAVATAEATTAAGLQNTELMEQAGLIEGLTVEYDKLTASLSVYTAETDLAAASQKAFALNGALGLQGMQGLGLSTGVTGGLGLAGGALASGVSSAVIPVMVAYFGTEALLALDGKNWHEEVHDLNAGLLHLFGGKFPGESQWQVDHPSNGIAPKGMLSHFDYFKHDAVAAMLPGLHGIMGDAFTAKQDKNTTAAIVDNTSDAIIGGGRKVININIKSFVDHFVVNAHNIPDIANQSREEFTRMLLEVLQSAYSTL